MLPLGGVHGDLHSLCDSVFPSDVACRLSHDCGSVSANRRMRSWCHSIVIDRRPLDSFFADLGPGEELTSDVFDVKSPGPAAPAAVLTVTHTPRVEP